MESGGSSVPTPKLRAFRSQCGATYGFPCPRAGRRPSDRPSSTRSRWRLATGSAILAHDVAAGNIDMAFVNPSALLTQAYRGVGLFDTPLPLRIVANYPSWDHFALVAHRRTGLKSLQDLKDRKYPRKVSVR